MAFRIKILLCVLLLTTAFVGCSLSKVEKPEVQLTNVLFKDVTLLQTTLDATIRIDNLNPFPLEISGAVHRIYLNGVDIGKARSAEKLSIPSLGTAEQQISVQLSHMSMLTKIQNLMAADTLNYKISSTFYSSGNLGLKTISTEQSGSVNLGAKP